MAPGFLNILYRWRRCLILVLTPLLLLPLPIAVNSPETRCAYMLLIMAVYWITEVLPLGVTALIPLVGSPVMRLVTSKKIAPEYMNKINVLFMGGLLVATAIEYWKLHKRIALGILLFMGAKPRWLMLGFMLPTWFLSMWISNTATTAMMIPIVDAVLQELKRQDTSQQPATDNNEMEMQAVAAEANADGEAKTPEEEDDGLLRASADKHCKITDFNKDFDGLCKCLNLSICYAATCGGMGTLTGTGPNLALAGFLDEEFGPLTGLNFGSYMVYAIPVSIICLLTCWIWLQVHFIGFRNTFRCDKTDPESDKKINSILKQEYKKLGPMTFAEKECVAIFVGLATLWISRSPGVPGWSVLFIDPATKAGGKPTVWVEDSTPAILFGILLFMLPSYNPFTKSSGVTFKDEEAAEDTQEINKSNPRSASESGSDQSVEVAKKESAKPKSLLEWHIVEPVFPWGIVLLLGGGFALAKTCKDSGLSGWIGANLAVLGQLPPFALIFLLSLGCAMLTEVTSNTATATIILPILASLSRCIQVHPLLIMLPAAVSCSYAFCLPVATPPNAIVFAKGHLTVADMGKAGLLMNIVAVFVVTLATMSYATAFFNMNTFPEWAGGCNKTLPFLATPNTTLIY